MLVYSTPPLDKDLEVTGYIKVHLWVASTAPSTDFTAKLVDVHPNGFARNVQEGICRVGSRQPLHPDQVEEIVIDLNATSNVFKAGHRLRLEISSSNFPRFDRNLNTAAPLGRGRDMRTALQTIFHDVNHPSHIVLPIIPR